MASNDLDTFQRERSELLWNLIPRQPVEVRCQALGRVAELSFRDDVAREAIWKDVPVAQAICVAARCASLEDTMVRTYALAAICNLSCAHANKELMWEDTSVRDLVIDGAEKRDLPSAPQAPPRARRARASSPTLSRPRSTSITATKTEGASGDEKAAKPTTRAVSARKTIHKAEKPLPQLPDPPATVSAAEVVVKENEAAGGGAKAKAKAKAKGKAKSKSKGKSKAKAKSKSKSKSPKRDEKPNDVIIEKRPSVGRASSRASLESLRSLRSLTKDLEPEEEKPIPLKLIPSTGKKKQKATAQEIARRQEMFNNKKTKRHEAEMKYTMKQMESMWVKARLSALSTLKSLAAARANQKPMWEHEQARAVLFAGAEDEDMDARARSIGVLKNLAAGNSNRVRIWRDPRARRVILQHGMLPLPDQTDGQQAEAQDIVDAKQQAIVALCNLAAADANVVPMWRDSLMRDCLLANLKLRDQGGPDLWSKIVNILQNLTATQSNKVSIWRHVSIRAELLVAAVAPLQPHVDVRLRAVSTLWSLSVAPVNHRAMQQDDTTMQALLSAVEGQHAELCLKGLGAVQNLAIAPENEAQMWGNARLRASIFRCMQEPLSMDILLKVADTLTNLSATRLNQEDMWANVELRVSIMLWMRAPLRTDGLKVQPSEFELQEKALSIFLSVAQADNNRVGMWRDGHFRDILVKCGSVGSERIRCKAVGTLWSLASARRNREDMWHSPARDTLMSGAEPRGEHSEVHQTRAYAYGALRCLAAAPDNQEAMWLDRRLKTVLITGGRPIKGCPTEIRAHAIGALRNLAVQGPVKEMMWRDSGVREVIALGMEAMHESELGIRLNAVGCFRRLASFAASRGVYVWQDKRAWDALLKAAEPQDDAYAEEYWETLPQGDHIRVFRRAEVTPTVARKMMSCMRNALGGRAEEAVVRKLNSDGSGLIARSKLEQVCLQLFGMREPDISSEQVANLCVALDPDGSGFVEIEELLNLAGASWRQNDDKPDLVAEELRQELQLQRDAAEETLQEEAVAAIAEICRAPAVRSQVFKDQCIPPAVKPLLAGMTKVNMDLLDVEEQPLRKQEPPRPVRPPFRPAGVAGLDELTATEVKVRRKGDRRRIVFKKSDSNTKRKKPRAPKREWEARFLYMSAEEIAAEEGEAFKVEVTLQGLKVADDNVELDLSAPTEAQPDEAKDDDDDFDDDEDFKRTEKKNFKIGYVGSPQLLLDLGLTDRLKSLIANLVKRKHEVTVDTIDKKLSEGTGARVADLSTLADDYFNIVLVTPGGPGVEAEAKRYHDHAALIYFENSKVEPLASRFGQKEGGAHAGRPDWLVKMAGNKPIIDLAGPWDLPVVTAKVETAKQPVKVAEGKAEDEDQVPLANCLFSVSGPKQTKPIDREIDVYNMDSDDGQWSKAFKIRRLYMQDILTFELYVHDNMKKLIAKRPEGDYIGGGILDCMNVVPHGFEDVVPIVGKDGLKKAELTVLIDVLPDDDAEEDAAKQKSQNEKKKKRAPLTDEKKDLIVARMKASVHGRRGFLKEFFKRLDKKGTGELDYDDMQHAVRHELEMTPIEITDDEITQFCVELDADASGFVSLQELVTWSGLLEKAKPKSSQANNSDEKAGKRKTPKVVMAGKVPLKVLNKIISSIKRSLFTDRTCRQVDEGFINKLDRDGSGNISYAEMKKACRNMFWVTKEEATDEQLMAFIKALDKDNSGNIEVSEVVAVAKNDAEIRVRIKEIKKEFPPETLQKIAEGIRAAADSDMDSLFLKLDADGSGELNPDEWKIALREVCEIRASVVSDEDIDKLFKLVDKDASGFISLEEVRLLIAVKASGPKKTDEESYDRARDAKEALPESLTELIVEAFNKAADGDRNALFKRIDEDGSGELDLDEMISACRDVLKLSTEDVPDADVEKLFKAIDNDDSGFISTTELYLFVST